MEFRQLEVYVRVYELRSFSKAAEELFLSQPSISAYISGLERELDTQLLHRSNKEFLATKAGRVFYDLARELLTLREKTVKRIKNFSDCSKGGIEILASSVPAQYILPSLLSEYHRHYQGVSFAINQMDTKEVVEKITSGEAEIGFVGAKIEPSKCIYHTLGSEKLVLIAPKAEQFNDLTQADIRELLRREYFIDRESGSGTKQEYEDCLKSIGIKPSELKVSACFNNTESIIHAVMEGLGLAIVSSLAAKNYLDKVTQIEVEGFTERTFYLVLRRGYTLSKTTEAFVNFVTARYK